MENMFLDGFGLSNFKCFKDEIKIAQRPITINIGPNNSGKSSLLKAINLFQHSLIKNNLIHNNAYQNILGEIDSFQLLNFGVPENYLNDPTKELSFRLPILFEEKPVWLINKNVEIKFHYLFEKQFQYNVDFTNLLRVEKRENAPPGLGKLNKYQIIIDNHLYFELTRNLQIENIYNGTEFGYFGELKIYPLNFIKQNDVNCIKIPLEIPTRKFHNIEYVQDIVTESLLKIGNIDAENIGYLVNSGLDSIYNFQNCISKIKFIDLNRREYGRYFDVTKSSLFKDFFEFYFNRQNSNI
ncbi:MAG: AAA family ATPase, partial [Bacteroidia bacterium]